MTQRNLMQEIQTKLLDQGADKVALNYSSRTQEEFNLIYKQLNLLRTVQTNSLSLIVIKDSKQASTRINQFDPDSIDTAVAEVMQAVENSNPDPAFDISPPDEGSWTTGAPEPDVDKVILRLGEFSGQMADLYPSVLYDAILSHHKYYGAYLNSNGTFFEHDQGLYNLTVQFSARMGRKMSSFNYVGFAFPDLDRELLGINFTGEFIRQSTEQTVTQPVPSNFTGPVILAPFVVMQLLGDFLQRQVGDSGLLTKSSRFPDHLGQKILDEKLTVINDPQAEGICDPGYFSSDGFRMHRETVIANGVLKHYPINLYAANKTGKARTMGNVMNLIIPAGDTSLAELIRSIPQGILCMRVSAGNPNANGDISAVVKNSYYIKDGAIAYPISETMLNGNLVDMLNSISGFSSERYYSGDSAVPYLQVKDIYISRK